MRDYNKLWNEATSAGTEKLKENEHKGGLSLDIFSVYKLLREEVTEVHDEIKTLRADDFRQIEDVDLGALRREYADCLNFAAMGIIECNRLIKERGYSHRPGEKFQLVDDI